VFDPAEDQIVLQGLADGLTHRQIARLIDREFPPTENSIKMRCKQLRKRLGALNSTHLVARAYQVGLLTVPDRQGAASWPNQSSAEPTRPAAGTTNTRPARRSTGLLSTTLR
jgi:DNA-binding CsgD family transcriptional regulator